MAEILGAVTTATQLFLEVNKVSIDNWTFKLFYKATTTILLACSIVASSKQFFGNPINCEVNGANVNEKVLEQYCWMYSTFNIPRSFRGVCARREHDGTSLYNSYYQWVSVFLVFSAMGFYCPRAIWLMMEGGLMKFLAKDTRGKIVEDAEVKRMALIQTFQKHLHNKYNSYAFWFLFCEELNFLVVLLQWFITNKFIKYHFLTYGLSVVQYYNLPMEERINNEVNPMCEAFPRIASCNYIRYGNGGMQETKNAICILGLNMINDKIFLILWFWYFFLTIFSFIRLFYRLIQICSAKMRFYILQFKMHRYFKTNVNVHHIKHYILHCSYGDWFVLYQMSRNMNRRFFVSFITELSWTVNPDPICKRGSDGKGDSCSEIDKNELEDQTLDLTYEGEDGKK